MKVIKFLYFIAAIAVLIGAASRLFLPAIHSYIYISGAAVFAVTQFLLRPKHSHFAVRRLVIQQQVAALLLVAAGVLMSVMKNNEWMVLMLCGAIMELYTAFRIPAEIEKHEQ